MLFRLMVVVLMLSPFSSALAAPPPAPVLASDHPLVGRIWQPQVGRFLTADELAGQMASAEAVLLGETHDNPDHHALQAWAVRSIAQAGRLPRLAFEMVERDRDGALQSSSGDLAGLGAALSWTERGWPDWALYRPIAEAAVAAGGTLSAANLSAETTKRIARGTEAAEEAERLGLGIALPDDAAADLAEEIRSSHCRMMPESAIPGMVRVQRGRDAEMAAVVADLAGRPGPGVAVLIAGAGHVRTDRGVPLRLRQIAPGLRVVSLGLVEVEAGVTDPAAYPTPYDAVWFTGRAEREDPCAQLMRHMKKKAEKSD